MEHEEKESKKQRDDDIPSPPPPEKEAAAEEEEEEEGEGEGEDQYEIESLPPLQETDSIQQLQLEHQNNNRNISHPPPPSLLHYYSPPQPPPPQEAESSPTQLRRVLEAPSPESPPIAPMPAAARPAQEGEGRGPAAASADGGGRRLRPKFSIMRKAKSENVRKLALLGSRVSGFIFCLISLAVLAADKEQGWALESFYRYKEFRYCLTVNVVGFVYSGVQAFDLSYSMLTKRVHDPARNRLRDCFDFSMDQITAYLLLSASTSAAFRVEDWETNWGDDDEFSAMARASVVLSFLAFVAFASSSILSGYTLFTSHSL